MKTTGADEFLEPWQYVKGCGCQIDRQGRIALGGLCGAHVAAFNALVKERAADRGRGRWHVRPPRPRETDRRGRSRAVGAFPRDGGLRGVAWAGEGEAVSDDPAVDIAVMKLERQRLELIADELIRRAEELLGRKLTEGQKEWIWQAVDG